MFSLEHIKRGGERHVTKPLRAFKDQRKPMNDLAFYTIVNNMTAHGDTRDIFTLAPWDFFFWLRATFDARAKVRHFV